MNKEQFNMIVEHQVKLMLSEKGLSRGDLNNQEYLKYKYEVAIKLLCELNRKG